MNLNAPFDQLDTLPRALWWGAITTACGTAAQRLPALQTWAMALNDGQLPSPDADLGAGIELQAMRRSLQALELARLAQGSPAMVEQVLRTMLWHLDRIPDMQPALSLEQAASAAAQAFHAEWVQTQGGWEEVQALLQGLGDLARMSADELPGLLKSREWKEAERISLALQRLPELAELITRLGRSEHAPTSLASTSPQPQVQGRAPARWVSTTLPDAPGEVKGIRLSGRLERMLGSEAAQMRHPVLRKLWRARQAEGRLLAYDSQAVLSDLRGDPLAKAHAASAPFLAPPLQRGPIILCLDTSGSMRGAPEHIAKAVALQAFRTAHREQRACHLVAFGGPGELLEHTMGLDLAGLGSLLALMGQAFDGGTDVQAPLERAIERVHQAAWASADLLLVSDGEFGCTPATLQQLDDARARFGLRVQGVLVGDRETMGLMEVCDAIHWVRNWRDHGPVPEGKRFSPVHSKSLTALFFPNALSERAARHRPP